VDLLACFGAVAVDERVVIDGNVVTGGGVTAGIDFALRIAAELKGDAVAQALQLEIQYAPAPPFDAGAPERAPPAVVAAVQARSESALAERRVQVEKAAALLGVAPSTDAH